MNHAKNIMGAALSALILAGCASSGGGTANIPLTQEGYMGVLADAKSALKQAAQANNIWRDSEKILGNAEKAAKSGDFEAAIKLAQKAKRQGELALTQAQSQQNAGPQL